MKKRFAIINSALAVAVLFSMLLQSVHSFEHLRHVFSEKECHHQYTGQADISHQHHPFDECFVCEFTFSAFITPQTFSYSVYFTPEYIPYNSAIPTEAVFSFSGSSYSLRGPPSAIV
jgi:hypothetical protein